MSRYSTGPTFPSVYANAEEGKGDPRILVSCSTIEAAVFEDPHDPEKISGARGIKARRGCIFGLLIRTKDNGEKEGRRKCDVVMDGQVVEPSFTKGEGVFVGGNKPETS